MSTNKKPESPQLPFTHSGGTKSEKPKKTGFSARDREKWQKESLRDESIHNAVYGKPRQNNQNSSPASRFSGEFLRKNYAQIEQWKKEYERNQQIPPQFDISDKKRDEFLRLIGWK